MMDSTRISLYLVLHVGWDLYFIFTPGSILRTIKLVSARIRVTNTQVLVWADLIAWLNPAATAAFNHTVQPAPP